MTTRAILFSLPQREYGGLHRLVELVREPFAAHGVAVRALVPAGSPAAARFDGDVTVVEVEHLRTLPNPRRGPRELASGLAAPWRASRQIAAHLAGGTPAAVHVFGFLDLVGPAVARRLRVPVVRSVNSSILPSVARPAGRFVLGRSAAVLYEGVPLLRMLAPRTGPTATVFYPASETPTFDERSRAEAARLRRSLGITAGQRVVGTWSNVTPQKGLDDFVRYAEQLGGERGDVHFVIAGRVPPGHEPHLAMLTRLVARSAVLDGRFTFLTDGSLDRDTAFALLDVFALTSRFEGVATATVEAMARAVPVVAHDVGSVSDIVIHDLTGGLVRPGSTRSFCDAVGRVLDDAGFRSATVDAARQHVDRLCSVERLADAFLGAYWPTLSRR